MPQRKTQEFDDKKHTYFQLRMELYGITPEINNISLVKRNPDNGEDMRVDTPIFREVETGIDILVYDLDRLTIPVQKNNSRWKKDFSMIRLENPIQKGSDTIKYLIPKNAGTHPFFPPHLVDKFEQGQQIPVLFLVEGYFKAFKAAMYGVDIVGLSSITHMKETGKNNIHPEILRLMTRCNVGRMVWLTDGDAVDITSKELTDGLDLYKRPNQFFQSVSTFKTLLEDYENVEKWFIHVDTDTLFNDFKDRTGHSGESILRADLKGIDDVLINLPDKAEDLVRDMISVSTNPYYFQKFNVTNGLSKVYKHFHLNSVNEFYLHHVERRPELKGKEFIFHGTRYLYDETAGECKVKMPKEIKDYMRVGDDYYKFVRVPNQYKKQELQFLYRRKSTIEDDHGKNFCKQIARYETFVNIPDHINFQPVVNGCFNVYSPLDHEPDDEECTPEDFPNIMALISHVFGDKTTSFTEKNADGVSEKKEYKMVDLALDYLQLLYQNPRQKLPILCLVSSENSTGKSTFAYFLRIMLSANVAIVGNQDLNNDFNAHWATKSVVICDEAKIDKFHVVEKIKMLSTAQKIFMNAKGRGQVELDCFIKFIMITNNEDNFISITDQDIRYWIIKVPVLKTENPKIIDLLTEEIPAFLSYLNNRTMATELKSRMWFHPHLLKTHALQKVISQSQPAAEKELRYYLKEVFLDTGVSEIMMSATNIHKDVFNRSAKYDVLYLSRIIKERMKVEHFHRYQVDGVVQDYETYAEALAVAKIKYEHENIMVEGKIKKVQKVTRYSYPKLEEKFEGGKKENHLVHVHDNGRPFVFKRADFVSADENHSVDIGQERKQFVEETTGKPVEKSSELPF